jgi:serine protease AprX
MGASMTTLAGLRVAGAGEGVAYARSWTGRSGRGGRQPLVAALVLSMLVAALGVGTPPTYAGAPVSVIVRAVSGGAHQVEELVTGMGGAIERRLPIIDGFSASLPADALPILERSTAVLSLSPNTPLEPQDGTYDPTGDINSMASTTQYTGASSWWDAGYTGAGVDVAVIDTGVAPVEGLSMPGKVIYGPDLSLESQSPNLTNLDTYGHGTFMAGLIAGHDTELSAPYSQAPASQYRGMAPDARIVSVKVGTADGGTDVSQVIAAISWVVQHAHDPGVNIRILNLSYGTNSTQSYVVDPLAYAAEIAWRKGIVVVTSGGNNGYVSGTPGTPALTNPAFDPFLIAVGSTNSNGTPRLSDDFVPQFSPRAIGVRGVDLVAPGVHLQGLRVPNSYVDGRNPQAVLGDRYFRGSGTSQSAAVVSGAAALVLQRYPQATPDQVKRLLTTSAYRMFFQPWGSGSGELQMSAALDMPMLNYTQTWQPSTGLGSLELARGVDHLTLDGVVLSGEQDIMGSPYNSATMAALQAQGASWSGGEWNGKSWSGASWSGASWSGASWSGVSWSGVSWSSYVFADNSWSGASWSGASWSGISWSGASWSGSSWSGQVWASANWN